MWIHPRAALACITVCLNVRATAFFASSLVFRRQRMRTRGRIYAALGYSVVAVAAKLGGKLVYKYRVGVDRTDGQTFPEDFATVMPNRSCK